MILSAALVLAPEAVEAQETILTLVKVTDVQESPAPVPSEIVHFLAASPNDPIPIDKTDAKGQLSLKFGCKLGTKVQARPHDPTFMYSRKEFCRETMSFRVPPITIQVRLQGNMDRAAEHGDFAAAALAATELASMEKRGPGQVAGEDAEFLSVIYAAKALDVEGGVTFDNSQSRPVMTDKMQDALRHFQVDAGLTATGQLDYQTLSTMSGTTSGVLRHGFYKPSTM